MVITSVCGTENSGSIPGSRPKQNPLLGIFVYWAVEKVNNFTCVGNRRDGDMWLCHSRVGIENT